tara:strand:- start:502 stop:696 length:195 start_codon:yes stop_codon:yes gene_type:complete
MANFTNFPDLWVDELDEVCSKCYVTPKKDSEIWHILYDGGKWLCKKCHKENKGVETRPTGGLFS